MAKIMVEERHITEASQLANWGAGATRQTVVADIAQALAEAEEAGRQLGLDQAEAAIRAMQPGPAKVESSFERFSANSKVILDCTRALAEARRRG